MSYRYFLIISIALGGISCNDEPLYSVKNHLKVKPKLKNSVWSNKKGAYIRNTKEEEGMKNEFLRENSERGNTAGNSLSFGEAFHNFQFHALSALNGSKVTLPQIFKNLLYNPNNQHQYEHIIRKAKYHNKPSLVATSLNEVLPHVLTTFIQLNHCLFTDLIAFTSKEKLNFSLIGQAVNILKATRNKDGCHKKLFKTLQKIFRERWRFNLTRSDLKRHSLDDVLKKPVVLLLELLAEPLLYAFYHHRDVPKIISQVLLRGNEQQIKKLMSLSLLPYEFALVWTHEDFSSFSGGSPLADETWHLNESARAFIPFFDLMKQGILQELNEMANVKFDCSVLRESCEQYIRNVSLSRHILLISHPISTIVACFRTYEMGSHIILSVQSPAFLLQLFAVNEVWKNEHYIRMSGKREDEDCPRWALRHLYAQYIANAITSTDLEYFSHAVPKCTGSPILLWNMQHHRYIAAKDVLETIKLSAVEDYAKTLDYFSQAVRKRNKAYKKYIGNLKNNISYNNLAHNKMVLEISNKQTRLLNVPVSFPIDDYKYIQCSDVDKLKTAPELTMIFFIRGYSARVIRDILDCDYTMKDLMELNTLIPILKEKNSQLAIALSHLSDDIKNNYPEIYYFIENSLSTDSHGTVSPVVSR